MKYTLFRKKLGLWCQIALCILPFQQAMSQDLAAIPLSIADKGSLKAPQPFFTPSPPPIRAKAYLLMDAKSGKLLVSHQVEMKLAPASLTKMMTTYLVCTALKSGRLLLDDPVFVSPKASKTGGSRMFIEPRSRVSVRDLLQGIIVQSGNDASVTIAEHLTGTEAYFTDVMNQQAKHLGMTQTHFANTHGLPHPAHYTSARDMAVLARALIQDFPEYYHWYSQKSFTYNNIKQLNRNRLLWLNSEVDGIKTGDTDEAGYCLVASAVRNGMRLISVVMDAETDRIRTKGSWDLLNYGFRFFETHLIHTARTVIAKPRVWFGNRMTAVVGLTSDLYITLPRGVGSGFQQVMQLKKPIKAPVAAYEIVGKLQIYFNREAISSVPMVNLDRVARGNVVQLLRDHCWLQLSSWIPFYRGDS